MESPRRIMLAMPEDMDLDHISEYLTGVDSRAEITYVSSAKELLSALSKKSYAAVIADYGLSAEPLETLKLAKAASPQTSFIFISNLSDEHIANEAVRQGASDYILRPEVGKLIPALNWALQNSKSRSRQKQKNQVLKKANTELEKRVKERTAKLSEMILTLQKEIDRRVEAEAALRKRTEQLRALASKLTMVEQTERRRIAGLLHEHLQQLIVAMRFQISLLQRSADPKTRQIAEELENLTNQTMEGTRTLTAELSPMILHRGHLIQAMQWLIQQMQEKHSLAVELHADAQAALRKPDLNTLLFHAVRELLLNVAKHSGTSSARIDLSATADQVTVMVSDKGAGFDPSFVDSAKERGAFGLLNIQERLEYIGGTMTIESTPDAGVTVTLQAPISADNGVKKMSETSIQQAVGGVPLDLPEREKAIRVLIADDHVVMRQGLSLLLDEEENIAVVGEASDGQAAVSLARQFQPDVILMDVSMPRLNGIEATRIIHREFPDIRIIGLSMFDEKVTGDAMREAGAVAYLVKSGDTETLVDVIEDCIRLNS